MNKEKKYWLIFKAQSVGKVITQLGAPQLYTDSIP